MNITENEEYNIFLDECRGIISERNFDVAIRDLFWRHELGSLVFNSKFYRFAREKTDFIKKLARKLNISWTSLYHFILFYKVYPDFDKFIQMYKPEKKVLRWADVRLLFTKDRNDCQHEETFSERIIIERTKCRKCMKTLDEKKQKEEL